MPPRFAVTQEKLHILSIPPPHSLFGAWFNFLPKQFHSAILDMCTQK